MEGVAHLFVQVLSWIGIAVIFFIIFSVAMLLKSRDRKKEEKHPIDKRDR